MKIMLLYVSINTLLAVITKKLNLNLSADYT